MNFIKYLGEMRYATGNRVVALEANLRGIEVGECSFFAGRPILRRHKKSTIKIGKHTRFYSAVNSNPLGLSQPCVIRTLTEIAFIEIGDRSGMSGGTICCGKRISIGNDTLIGAGALIIDNDFHCFRNGAWVNDFYTKAREIQIGSRVFIGARAIILKGVKIEDGAIVGAGAVVTTDVRSNTVVGGNPAKFLRYIS